MLVGSYPISGINKLQAKPSEVVHHSVPLTFQVAYKTYTNFLPAYMRAYTTQQRVDASQSFLPIIFNKDDVFPLSYPNIAVAFTPSPPAEVLDRLKAHGYQEVTFQKEKVIIVTSPTPEIVKFIMERDHRDSCPAPQNTVNTSCLGALMMIRKIFSCFLQTHQYPAFSTEEHAVEIEKYKFASSGGKRRMVERSDERSKKSKTSTGRAGATWEEDETMDNDESIETSEEAGSEIKWALPPPRNERGWGDFALCPSGDGVYSPFIPELALADAKAVYLTIQEHFLSCLGSNTEEVKASLEQLRGRLAIIAKTREGEILAHMARCIHLSITGQSKCYPVIEGGVYQGSVLIGARVKYIINKDTISPVPFDQLQEKVKSFGSHKSALLAILGLCHVTKPEDVAMSLKNITSMYKLRLGVLESPTSAVARDEVLKLSSQLRFGPSRAVNPDTLHDALDLIANPTRELPLDFPLHHSMLFETDRVAIVWSSFGDTAPSPSFPGKKFDLGRNDHPSHIGFKTGVPLREAIADLKHVLNTKQIAVPPLNRRGTVYSVRVYAGADGKKLWVDMKSAAGVSSVVAGSSSVPVGIASSSVFADF